jgi:crotonobetainyl-CoA hydratase
MTLGDIEAPAATLERIGKVALITLNRPQAMNAVNSELASAVGEALEVLDNDPALAVGVLTGAGKAFCAGADLKEIAAGRAVGAKGHPEWGFAGVARHPISKPLIAAVNGFALGGGTELVLSCDLAVVSRDAKFGLPEVKRGLLAAAGGVLRLPRQVPLKFALELALTGDPIDAETAAQWGLANRVVDADQVVETALALARRIAENAPLSVQASKRVIYHSAAVGSDWDPPAWELNDSETARIFATKDAKEGSSAFAQKREPRWTGE